MQNPTANMLTRAAEYSFLLLVFSLAFMQPQLPFGGTSVTITDGLFLVTLAIWLAAVISGRSGTFFHSSFILFGLYGIGLTLSAVLSEEPRRSSIKLIGELYLIALAAVTANIVLTEKARKRVVIVWIAAAGIACFIGVLAVICFYAGAENIVTRFALHHFGSLPPGHYPRLQGTFLYPAVLCNYLTVALMMTFAAWELKWITTTVFTVLISSMAITIAFTITPGLGGVLLAVGMWLWSRSIQKGQRTRGRISLCTGFLSAMLFWLVSAVTVIPSPTSPFSWSVDGLRIDPTQRLLTWMGAAGTFISHPLFGKGLGLPVAEVYFMPPSGQMQLLTDAHNFVLNIAGQAGLAGVVPLVLICVCLVWGGRDMFRSPHGSDPVERALWIAFVSAFVVQGMVGSFEDSRHLWALMGLMIAGKRSSRGLVVVGG